MAMVSVTFAIESVFSDVLIVMPSYINAFIPRSTALATLSGVICSPATKVFMTVIIEVVSVPVV